MQKIRYSLGAFCIRDLVVSLMQNGSTSHQRYGIPVMFDNAFVRICADVLSLFSISKLVKLLSS